MNAPLSKTTIFLHTIFRWSPLRGRKWHFFSCNSTGLRIARQSIQCLYYKIYNLKQKALSLSLLCSTTNLCTYILWPRDLCRAAHIRRENTLVRSAEEEGKRVYLSWNAHVENGAVLVSTAEYQISRNELPCAKSPIVRDLIGDCRELSVFKPRCIWYQSGTQRYVSGTRHVPFAKSETMGEKERPGLGEGRPVSWQRREPIR